MNVTELFIRRPVMTTLVMLGLLFFGIVAYFNLPVSYLPAVEFPTIQVTATLPGASPDTMASSVASPLEREFSAIAGLKAMSSQNSQGQTTITLQFDLDRDIDAASVDVQAAITKAEGSLPDTMTDKPSFTKVNPADSPILYMAVGSSTLPLSTVNDYAKTFLTQSLSMVNGVAQVIIYGERKYAVRIKLDPRSLAAKGIGINEVRDAVSNANVNLPLGTLEGKDTTLTINAKGQIMRAKDYAPIIIAYREGQPVRLSDLGTVKDGVEDDLFSAWYNGEQKLIIAIKRQPGSNTIAVVEAIKAKLPLIRKQMPASISMDIVYDQSLFIDESVEDVKFTLGLAIVLVIIVVFVFLRSMAGTIISAIAIPFSIIATFAVMQQMNFTLDTLSLMALTLAVGFVVDDAIVMLENIFRHMEMGKGPMEAAFEGAKEIGFTIISMTLSLAVVFIPIMFMSGIIGRVLHEFAMTITIAILVSGVVSLSLTPMMSSRILKKSSKIAESDPFFNWLQSGYRTSLAYAIKHRFWTMMISVAMLGVTAWIFIVIPKGFLPANDTNFVMGFVQARQGISYDALLRRQLMLNDVLKANPNVRGIIQVVGVPLANQGMLPILLKTQDKRKLSADEVVGTLMGPLNTIPGLMCFVVNPPMIEVSGKQSRGAYQFTLQSPDSDALYREAQKFTDALRGNPMFEGVNSDLQIANPEVKIVINRDMASSLGISAMDIENALYSAYGERRISSIYASTDTYKVIMEVLPEFQKSLDSLSMIYVRSPITGLLVRLDSVASLQHSLGPVTVNHSGQLPSVTLSFNGAPGTSIGEVTKEVDKLAAKLLPESISTMFEGTAGAFQSSMGSIYFLLFIAIVVIYILLGCLYESFIHPITILSGLPSAALGGLLTLMIFGLDLNLYGMVGIIMLIGIVKKNSIMVVDFAIAAEAEGKSPQEAAFEGSVVRFRPIMMTTLSAVMGALPIAIGFGAGAEARRPLGLVVVGGLVLSQVVTLYLTPVFYTYMDELQLKLKKEEKAVEAEVS